MAYLDNPLIPAKQQAPSGMFQVGINPQGLGSLFAYWNAQVDNSLFTDTLSISPVVNDGDDVKAWRELTGFVSNALEATDNPIFSLVDGIKSVEFRGTTVHGTGDTLEVPSSIDQFNFMHSGLASGGEIIGVYEVDSSIPSTNNVSLVTNINSVGADQFTGFSQRVNVGVAGSAYAALAFANVTSVNSFQQTNGNYERDTPHVHQWAYITTTSGTLELDNADVKDISFGSAATDPDDASTNLVFGAQANSGFTPAAELVGRMYSVAIFNPPLDAETREGVTTFLAKSAGFIVPGSSGSERTEIFSSETGYADFPISLNEIFYEHAELVFCQTHSVFVKSDSGTIEVTVTFYAGDTVTKVETLTDEGIDFNVPGITRIGFKTIAGAATGRSWSR
jgi:hypothetical protein